jgi:neutral trehalase
MLERNIAWMANQTGNATLSGEYNTLASKRKEAIEKVLWNPDTCES